MNGPGHYRKAEQLLEEATKAITVDAADYHVRKARAHAQLAEVAAILDAGTHRRPAWNEVLGQ